jgi:hypothetical protein
MQRVHPETAARALLRSASKGSGKSRSQIAEEMSKTLDRRITRSMIDDFTAESKSPVRFPAAWVPTWCCVVGDDRLQRSLLDRRLRNLLELGEHTIEANRLRGEIAECAAARRRRTKVKGHER